MKMKIFNFYKKLKKKFFSCRNDIYIFLKFGYIYIVLVFFFKFFYIFVFYFTNGSFVIRGNIVNDLVV
jgi:hypothetical protein